MTNVQSAKFPSSSALVYSELFLRVCGYGAIAAFAWLYRAEIAQVQGMPKFFWLLPVHFLSFILYSWWLRILSGKATYQISVHTSLVDQVLPQGGFFLRFVWLLKNYSGKRGQLFFLLGYPVLWNLWLAILWTVVFGFLDKRFSLVLLIPLLFPLIYRILGIALGAWMWKGAIYSVCLYILGLSGFTIAYCIVKPEVSVSIPVNLYVFGNVISVGGILSAIPGVQEACVILAAKLQAMDKAAAFTAMLLYRCSNIVVLGTISLLLPKNTKS